jgi:hypothetical protein
MAHQGWVSFLFLTAIVCSTASVGAKDRKDLEGGFFLSEEGCDGKTPSPECVLSFQISGPAARALYEKLEGKATFDECTQGPVKTDGNGLNCYKREGDSYDCDFGYSFKRKTMVQSEVSC